MTNEKHFPKTIGQWEFDYDFFTNLPKIILACDFSPSSIVWYIPGYLLPLQLIPIPLIQLGLFKLLKVVVLEIVLCDVYNHKIAAWVNSLKAHFFKKENELCSTKVLDHSSNTIYFYSKSILHPYVNLLQSKKGFILKNTDFIDII